jgi:hypothetical protein
MIPAINESESIGKVLDDISKFFIDDIVLVDN